jgi:hypothetical protein
MPPMYRGTSPDTPPFAFNIAQAPTVELVDIAVRLKGRALGVAERALAHDCRAEPRWDSHKMEELESVNMAQNPGLRE